MKTSIKVCMYGTEASSFMQPYLDVVGMDMMWLSNVAVPITI